MSQQARLLNQAALADLAEAPATSRWARNGPVRLHVLDYANRADPAIRADSAIRADPAIRVGSAGSDTQAEPPPLVMVPGITTPAIGMDFVARRLTDLVRPIVVDVRGRGLSDSAPSYQLADYAADLEVVVRELDLPAPILFGHSMGARIVAAAACRAQVPTRGLILAEPPMSGPGRPYPTTLAQFQQQLLQAQQGASAEDVAQSWPRWPVAEQWLRARWLASCDSEAIEATHRGFESDDFFSYWPHLAGPTVLMYGQQSPVLTRDDADRAREANPTATMLGVEDAGHMLFWDTPEPALTVLREAIGALLGADSARIGAPVELADEMR